MKTEENVHTLVFDLFGDVGESRDTSKSQSITLSRIVESIEMMVEAIPHHSNQILKPIFLISSRGGSTEEALRIHDYLAYLPFEVTTVAVGGVESAATFIYLAGKRRLATPTSYFQFHDGRVRLEAAYEDLLAAARAERKKQEIIIDIVADAVGDRRKAARLLRNTYIFRAHEAKELGIVHEMTKKIFPGDSCSFANRRDGDCRFL